MQDYVQQATRTLSNEFHAELIDKSVLIAELRHGIQAAEHMDKVKKALFYGRPAPGLECRFKNIDNARIDMRNALKALHPDPIRAEQVLHGVIGLFTEAGEMLEAVLEAIIDRKPLDAVNMIEEVGDGKWYMAILAHALPFSWGTDEVVNIEKLRKRFPDKFTEYDANTRDLDGERKVLEAG
jgi:NTP pyrophosphatase (non-canonical NTP hydrolase)